MSAPATPVIGNEVIFSTDPLAEIPRVTALADDTFVLAWETATGDLFARHLNETGNFTTGNFLQQLSTFDHNAFGGPSTTPLIVQENGGAIMTDFGFTPAGGSPEIGLHTVDANFTDTSFPVIVPKASSAGEPLVDAVPTFQGTAVSFERQEGTVFHTFLRWYGPDGTPSPTDQQLGNPGDTGSAINAKLLSSGTDLVYTVFTHFDPATGNRDIRFESLTPNGINSNAISLSGVAGTPDFADIADLGDGTFVVVWQDAGGVIIKHMLFNGITLETARIGEAAGGLLPKVVALKDHSFIVAWTAASGTESDGSPNEDIFLRHFVIVPQSPGSPINVIANTGTLVHLTEPGDQGLFQMSMKTLADGRVLLAYASETGDATNLNNMVYRIIDPRDPNLTGTANADVITAAPNASVINGLGGNDTLIGLTGNDALNGGDGNDTVDGGLGNDVLDGGAGFNTAAFNHLAQAVVVDLSKGTATGQGTDTLHNIQNVTGSILNDTFIGSAVRNVFDGGGGNDTVKFNGVAAAVAVSLANGTATGQGADVLRNIENVVGSNLNDTIIGSSGDNIIDGGAGVDTVQFNAVSAAVTVSLATGVATGQGTDTLRNIENVTGSNLNDTITGNNGNNVIDGGGGADVLAGLGGNDTYFVDNAADVVKEAAGAGNDQVFTTVSYKLGAGQSIETLSVASSAGGATINLTGNELSQAIIGNDRPNFINGGGGNDTLTGKGGADTFMFNTALSATGNVDRITDFAPSSDKIDLAKSIFSALNVGTLPSTAFFVGPAAHDADDRIVYNPVSGSLTYDSNGNAAGGATQFATLTPHLALQASNFVVT